MLCCHIPHLLQLFLCETLVFVQEVQKIVSLLDHFRVERTPEKHVKDGNLFTPGCQTRLVEILVLVLQADDLHHKQCAADDFLLQHRHLQKVQR